MSSPSSPNSDWHELPPDAPLELQRQYRVCYAGGSRPGQWRDVVPVALDDKYVMMKYPADGPLDPPKKYLRERITRVKARTPEELAPPGNQEQVEEEPLGAPPPAPQETLEPGRYNMQFQHGGQESAALVEVAQVFPVRLDGGLNGRPWSADTSGAVEISPQGAGRWGRL